MGLKHIFQAGWLELCLELHVQIDAIKLTYT